MITWPSNFTLPGVFMRQTDTRLDTTALALGTRHDCFTIQHKEGVPADSMYIVLPYVKDATPGTYSPELVFLWMIEDVEQGYGAPSPLAVTF